MLGAACLLVGTWVTRRVGFLGANAPAAETLGVGLGSGLLILAAGWAAVGSGGQSAFTPIAIGFVVALVLAFRRPTFAMHTPASNGGPQRFSRVGVAFACVAFVVAMGLTYGATVAPSPRNGEQPIEFRDEAYYAALAIDLNRTGVEANTATSGFDSIEGFPVQNWYHWGEIWITAAAVRIFNVDPVLARHYIVLPLLLLATASLAGTLVRRILRTASRRALLFGAAASLLLAPIPLLPGALSGWWAVGLLFSITLYGLSVIAALLSLYVVARDMARSRDRGLQVMSGTVVASLFATHVVVAVLAMVGIAAVAAVTLVSAVIRGRRIRIPSLLLRAIESVLVMSAAVVFWGFMTGHALGITGKTSAVAPFNHVWAQTVAFNAVAAGVFLAIPIAWLVGRSAPTRASAVYLGVSGMVVFGAIAWGARIAEYDAFHIFFAAVCVFAIPVAAVATWSLWIRLRAAGRLGLASALLVVAAVQIEFGALSAITRLQLFGPGRSPPIPLEMLEAIRALPAGAHLAYACKEQEDFVFWAPGLVSIYAHTGRTVVPMCFQEDASSVAIGGDPSLHLENTAFRFAPQHALFGDGTSKPSTSAVVAFLRTYGIHYVYADSEHPNSLVPDARTIAAHGDTVLLEIP